MIALFSSHTDDLEPRMSDLQIKENVKKIGG